MELHASEQGWRLTGHYDADSLLKIKQRLEGASDHANGSLDLSQLQAINAPVIALLIEIRRRSDTLTLKGCREEFREMLKLYGVECIFQFA
ncbi:hypothetical protein MAQ5080_00795 [Marinomonas aquimarina]|uniref:STAS domain-containing protein n=1 Tax=Marinomonas aquimarina TaxID=295068 RepID=A0A1A8T6L2_9GAMM|nr:STAS domain-containing protein [Marinomonas aquimarina]SBS27344.1 hypothetical protein MAQ5080_00795 [Marinomonas aquimarina]